MAYVIGGGCIMCGSCAGECPVGAIAEGDGKYEINADACVDCGTCAGACPKVPVRKLYPSRGIKPEAHVLGCSH